MNHWALKSSVIWPLAILHSQALVLISCSMIFLGNLLFWNIYSFLVSHRVHSMSIKQVPSPWEVRFALKNLMALNKDRNFGTCVSKSNQDNRLSQHSLAKVHTQRRWCWFSAPLMHHLHALFVIIFLLNMNSIVGGTLCIACHINSLVFGGTF